MPPKNTMTDSSDNYPRSTTTVLDAQQLDNQHHPHVRRDPPPPTLMARRPRTARGSVLDPPSFDATPDRRTDQSDPQRAQ